jgi:hypothetical protein
MMFIWWRRNSASFVVVVVVLHLFALLPSAVLSFWTTTTTTTTRRLSLKSPSGSSSELFATTKLPADISPFVKSKKSTEDIPGKLRQIAAPAIDRAIADGILLLEVDFPPLLGEAKSNFDDFDNLSELDANRDWCVQLIPLLRSRSSSAWLIFPDDKECELAKREWTGQFYRKNTKFTSIRAACEAVGAKFTKAWGTRLAETANRVVQGGDGILADSSMLDDLNADSSSSNTPFLQLVCQPGNGGPVEDWINVECLHNHHRRVDSTAVSSSSIQQQPPVPTCIVNGALDKVRDGYYPSIFFPALAQKTDFYRTFEGAFVLKPITDKGVYGWLFRVYPEPWQVILQTASRNSKGKVVVTDTVVFTSNTRPSYTQAVQALVLAALKQPT